VGVSAARMLEKNYDWARKKVEIYHNECAGLGVVAQHNHKRTIQRMTTYSYKVSEGFLAKPSARVAVEYARLVSAKVVRAFSALLMFLAPLAERRHCNAASGQIFVESLRRKNHSPRQMV